ncbi:MAG: SDR family oxidoreductase, partial [Acholeplasmataceae bacterium]|nr:SDR family oxidoreductase [Acholeplasmataceae bacterium]
MRRSKVHFDFSNFSCIVTGGTKGIGYEIADLLGRSGAHIGVCARNQNDLAHVVSEFTAKGYHFTTYRCDLTDSDAIKPMVDFFVDEFGGTIDGLVNNAGMNILESMGELRAEAVKQVIGLNLVAPILVTNAVVPYMKKESFGRIVNIASLSSVTGFYDHTAY